MNECPDLQSYIVISSGDMRAYTISFGGAERVSRIRKHLHSLRIGKGCRIVVREIGSHLASIGWDSVSNDYRLDWIECNSGKTVAEIHSRSRMELEKIADTGYRGQELPLTA